MTWAGLVRVITTDGEMSLNVHGRLIEAAFPGLRVVSRCIRDHPEGVHDARTEATAAPLVAGLAAEFQEQGASVVLVSCAADPGVPEASRSLRIPVIGAGTATSLVASALSDRVGVIGISDEVPDVMARALGNRLVAYAKPEGVSTTLHLAGPVARDAAIRAAREVAQKGARVIALACTGYSTTGMASLIRQATGLPVVDPVLALGLYGYYAAVLEGDALPEGREP